jgi:hypothetical protein
MDGLLPFFLVAGLLVAMFAALGVWGWRRFPRTSSFGTGATAVAVPLRNPAERLAEQDADADKRSVSGDAGPRDMPDSLKGGVPDVSVMIDRDDVEASDTSPSSDALLEILPAQEDAPKEKTQHAQGKILASPPVPSLAASVPADAGILAGPSDTGPGADGGDAEQPATRAVRDSGETPAQPVREVLLKVDEGIPIPTAVDAERTSASFLEDSPGPAHEPTDETPVETALTCAAQQDVLGHAALDAVVCETAAGPDREPEVVESAALSSDVSEEIEPDELDDGDREADPAPVIEPTAERSTSLASTRPRQPAVHRDRRGGRRATPAAIASSEAASPGPAPATRPAAEAKLRLSLHPIRRTARLSVVLTRPDGFPERVTLQAGDESAVEAYDAQRYDDLDLPWTSELLIGELRLASTDGFRWVRSARQIHIFAADPNEPPDLISVGAARPGVTHALVCRSSDAADVRSAAASAGSPDLHAHEHWHGIPDGWMVLSGYAPAHAANFPLPIGLRPLDPGTGLEIVLEGGLAIRPRVYAGGHPPRILISPTGSASTSIGGQPATLSASGAWEAPGWDAPGQHIVDVVPGPSASYEIAADPWVMAGWDFWNAHSGRFENQPPGPWTRAEICGAQIRGPAGEAVFAAETQPTLIALGLRSGAAPLHRRGDVSVSIGFMAEAPAFLLAATGQRRTQGRVVWLGLTPASQASRQPDPDWVAVVRTAASRRLPLERSDALGEDSWRKAKERARRLKRPRA